jgi:hypothetical protein
MRIVNEKYLALIWNWDEAERGNLEHKYQTNLERLAYAIQERLEAGTPPPPEALRDLAAELQEAGELLEQSAQNCFAVARSIYAAAAPSEAERSERMASVEAVENHVGKPVVLSQTSAPELQGRQLILHEVRGTKAVLRDGDSYWEALIDFVVPVEGESRGGRAV